ncbi:Caleosin related protein-domain-containing protein [Bombardia bombarda]|uniref:Caleosin related protein-domain-containing protein n=1 Tax=Bombardia bombarda TaxID=252184 RepID=A0AA40C571_9PEZI|nr:Caleosin related protein-domain-containing protein [Bombardia bombarda]
MSQESGFSSPITSVDEDPINFDLSAGRAPATNERQQAIDADSFIEKPAIARANIAPSSARPDGSAEYARGLKDYTVLQQHVLFWDRDGDGRISPWDTFVGFRDLGFSLIFSLLSMFIINVNFSYPTRLAYSYFPDPFFRVYVGGIHKAKHGSDSGTYDKEGRFVPQMFEDMFSKWDTDNDGSLSASQLYNMTAGHRLAGDPFGWFAAIFEFGSTWLLLQKDGRVLKEDLRQTYDGSIFWRIREEILNGKGWNKGAGPADFADLVLKHLKTKRI